MPVPPIPEDRQDGTTIRAAHVNQIAAGVNDLQQQIDDLPPGGYSAYELWLQEGNTGSMADFLESLESDVPGPPGDQGEPGISPDVTAIAALPDADPVTGAELVAVSQDDVTAKVTLADVLDTIGFRQGPDGELLVDYGGGASVRVGVLPGILAAGVEFGTAPNVISLKISIVGESLSLGASTITNTATGLRVEGGPVTLFAGGGEVGLSGWLRLNGQASDPAAPPANQAKMFSRAVGGKMQLCARFPSGAVQVIATEP